MGELNPLPDPSSLPSSSTGTDLSAEWSTGNRFVDLGRLGPSSIWKTLVVFFAEVVSFLAVSVLASVIVLVEASGRITSVDQLSPLLILIAAGLPFYGAFLALVFGVRVMNHRPVKTLVTPLPHPRWDRFWRSFLVWLVLSALGDLVIAFIISPGNYVFQFQPQAFLPYALAVLVFIPVQSATEELTFRGYLLQGIGVATRSAWLAWIVTSVIFGLLHIMNNEIQQYGLGLLVDYIGLGLFLGWLTLRGEGLETALGVHIATNLYATLMVTFPGSSLPAPAIFRTLTYNPVQNSLVLAAAMLLFLLYFYRVELKRGS
ncbi:MAG TPA: type II CAAX endopeptidase family protein [Anaerolineaceae bacterium]|nr:type II CAAX endopeptidase family protein [Anaerolineaceae bacterium]